MAPTPLPLEKWQRNQIFESIRAASLEPRDFDLIIDTPEVRLWLKGSPSVFTITTDAHPYRGSYRVGDGAVSLYESGGWKTITQRLDRWLAEVKRDVDTPDLWAGLQREAAMIGATSTETIANTPFTQDEQTEIATKLREQAASVKQAYPLSEAQAKELDEKIEFGGVSPNPRKFRPPWWVRWGASSARSMLHLTPASTP